MPTYRYQAIDSTGRSVAGEITASDVRNAQQLLRQRGLIATHLSTVNPSTSGTPRPPLGQDIRATGGARPQPAPRSRASARTTGTWERTRVSPHQMVVWLIQLRSMLKAGMTPANAFESLSGRIPHRGLQHASREIARSAAQGIPISESMQRFPELFPSFVVGAFRAAEYGGYLPEMLERLIVYFEQWRIVRRWSVLTQGCLWHAVLLLPLIAPFGVGLLWGLQRFEGGGTADALRAIAGGVGQAFLRYGLPMALAFVALLLLGYLLLGNERIRARLRLSGSGFLSYADWIRAQSLEQYLFHLSRLTQAGVAPATAHALAASAVPNRVLAESLLAVDLGRAEGAKHLDLALERSGLFPIEEVMLARTGVQTGELPATLQTLAAWYKERADTNLRQLPRAFARLVFFISLVAVGIAAISLAWGYYRNVFHAVERFMGVGE
ncbi:MAG: type II secretion system F family protein [Fimbriimonadales bacterium]|nr:type II secretion system F family protein [Fimbriimonadales bacterium]